MYFYDTMVQMLVILVLIHFTFISTICYNLHYTDKETKAQVRSVLDLTEQWNYKCWQKDMKV